MRRLLFTLTLVSLWTVACSDDPDIEAGGTTLVPVSSAPTSTTVDSSTIPSTSSTLPPPSSSVVTPTVPTTTTVPVRWPVDVGTTTLPDVVIADGTTIDLYRSHDGVVLDRGFVAEAAHRVTDVHQASDGDVFVREIEVVAEDESVEHFVRYDFDAGREELDVEWIYDVARVDGVESVIVAVAGEFGGFGGVEARSVEDGHVVAEFGLAAEAEFGVTHFAWSETQGIGVASAWADLTEWIGFVQSDGASIELPSPTTGLPYGEPPYVTGAAISPDGDTLYWVEGPDWGFDDVTNESGPVPAAWVLYGADLTTGETGLEWPVTDVVLDSTVLDIPSIVVFDEFVLLNRATLQGTEWVPRAPLVLDLSGEEPELYEYPVIGIATASAI